MEIKKVFNIIFCCLIFLMMIACDEKKQQRQEKQQSQQIAYVVKPKLVKKELFFIGTIKPLNVISVNSEFDGVVIDRSFVYGQYVKKDQVLLTIVSQALEREFLSSLGNYVRAIDDLSEKKSNLTSSKKLFSLGYISKNEFQADKTSFKQAKLSAKRSRYQMQQILKKMDLSNFLEKKDLSQETVIDQLLNSRYETVAIKAPNDGVIVVPDGATTGDNNPRIEAGETVRQGEVLFDIGNLKGLLLEIKVSEIDISQIRLNQKAVITGDAFPGIELFAYVQSIAGQAEHEDGGLPKFKVRIVVPEITNEHREKIYMGMRGKVSIIKEMQNTIKIPLDAVHSSEGKTWVNLKTPYSKKLKKVEVITGETDMDMVIISKGLKEGDTIVYDY